MIGFVKAFIALCLLVTLIQPIEVSAISDNEQRVIITFKNEVNESLIEKANGEINNEFNSIPAASVTISDSGLNELKNNSNIKKIEKDVIVRTSEQIQDWGIQSIKTPLAWGTGYTGKGIKVAIIDSGISPHEDLVIAGGKSFVNYTSSYQDDNGHGTHVAGIIGAKNNSVGIRGVASEAELYALKAFDQTGSSYLSHIIAGIDWSIANNMDIINLSLGAQVDSTALKNVVDQAYNKGIILVAAAGNDGNGSGDTVDYPARYSSVIGVGAIDQQNRHASFSSTGPTVEIVAPGVSILSTYNNGSYARLHGTSMATPFVVGYLALLKQAYPGLTNVQLRKTLADSAKDLGAPGLDSYFGYGLVQASAFSKPLYSMPSTGNPATTVTINPSTNENFVGQSTSFTAIVKLKDGTVLDITNDAMWMSSNEAIATVSAGKVLMKEQGQTSISAIYGGILTTINVVVKNPNPVVDLKPSETTIKEQVNAIKQLTVKAILKDGTAKDVTQEAVWKSFDESVAIVKAGKVDFRKAGKTMITASYDNKVAVTEVETIPTPIVNKDFLDVDRSHWAYAEINQLRDEQIITGYQDNTFRPKATIRRDHVAVLFTRALPLDKKVELKNFLDVPVTYHYYDEIMKTQQAGIFSGDRGNYEPLQNLTREHMAKILVIAFDLEKKGEHPFTDVSKNHWSNEYINILYSNGITIGFNGQYHPKDPVTRAQFAAFLSRAFALEAQ